MTMRETFAVLGLSQFGLRTATGLFEAGASVIAVDKDESVVQRASPHCTQAFCADAADFEVMAHLGVFDVDTVIIGLRKSFEACVLLVHHLTTQTSVRRVIAQVDTTDKARALRRLGVHLVVFPESDSADHLVRGLTLPDVVNRIPLSAGSAVIELACPPSFVGKSLGALDVRKRFGVHVVGVKRGAGDEPELLVAPPPDTVFRAGDLVMLIGRSADLDDLARETRSG